MNITSDYNKIDPALWKEFVDNHSRGNIFQSPEMVKVYEASKNYVTLVLLAMDNSGTLIGVLVGIIQKEDKGLMGFFSSRCIIQGGPLVLDDNPQIIHKLLEAYTDEIRLKCIYSQIRNLTNYSELMPNFLKYGFKYQKHLNLQINLSDSFESLKNTIHKSRLRNYQKSLNKGTTTKVLHTLEEIRSGYELLRQNYRRIKLPVPDLSHFEALFELDNSGKHCLFWGVFYKEQIIGFRVSLIYKDTIYDYYAGGSPEHSNKYPNDVVIIEILKWACKNGYRYFDFGGAGKPGVKYGVRDYKMNFSDQLFEFGRFEKIHYPLVYNLAKIGFYLWKRL